MLYSILLGFATYYLVVFFTGVLVNTAAIEGSLITFAVLCFLGAYLTHRYSRLVHRLAMTAGIFVTTLLVAKWFLLPLLTLTWVSILATILGFAVYVWSRRLVYRRYFRRNRTTGARPAPPFGREWCRWVFLFVL